MATPALTKHSLPGALGDILIDLRTGDRKNPRPAVAVLHGFKGFKDWGMFPAVAERLAKAGMSVVSFNVSGSGVDDSGEFSYPAQFGRNSYSAELEDVGRVISALQDGTLGIPAPTSLGVLGHSRGGGIGILEAGRNRTIQALVTWAAIGSVDRWSDEAKKAWRRRGFVNIQNARTGQIMPLSTDVLDDIATRATTTLDIPAAAARVQIPWLIVHGDADESVDVADARLLHQASSGGARLLIVEGASHTFGATHPLKEVSPALDRVMMETVRWFSQALT